MNNIKRIHSNLYFVSDLERTANFYVKLGFDTARSDDAVRIKLGDFTLVFMDETKVQIDKEVGKPSSEPTTFPWGKREFAVKDLDGFKIIFYQGLGK
ncbi:hypothetical protein FWF48_00610 [Candidatus Saccharibacteria bacterium]|nr:hypothetical protein [Candidatus Saccharibacteria bacterium]